MKNGHSGEKCRQVPVLIVILAHYCEEKLKKHSGEKLKRHNGEKLKIHSGEKRGQVNQS